MQLPCCRRFSSVSRTPMRDRVPFLPVALLELVDGEVRLDGDGTGHGVLLRGEHPMARHAGCLATYRSEASARSGITCSRLGIKITASRTRTTFGAMSLHRPATHCVSRPGELVRATAERSGNPTFPPSSCCVAALRPLTYSGVLALTQPLTTPLNAVPISISTGAAPRTLPTRTSPSTLAPSETSASPPSSPE